VRKLNREQGVAIGVLGLFILLCIGAGAWALVARSDAAWELSQRQDLLSRLETAARGKARGGGPSVRASAPASAFLDAPTLGLASAMLEEHITHLADQHATLVSFAVQSAGGADSGDAVRIEASMDINLRELQTLLYELESGAPYVFVDSITVRPVSGAAQSDAAAAPLRTMIGLRGLWRRSPS
jgi:general secretion pathway protein M